MLCRQRRHYRQLHRPSAQKNAAQDDNQDYRKTNGTEQPPVTMITLKTRRLAVFPTVCLAGHRLALLHYLATCRVSWLVTRTTQHRKPRVFGKTLIGRRKVAQIEDRPTIRLHPAHEFAIRAKANLR